MAAAVREKGFQATTLADVVREAKASRRTFYAHFTDPTDCYLALLESVSQQNLAAVAEAIGGEGTPEERLGWSVGSYLDALERDPLLSRSFFREVHLTGERGRDLVRSVNERAGQTIHLLTVAAAERESELDVHPIPVDMARMIVSGIVQMALSAQEQGSPLDGVRTTATNLLRRVLLSPAGDSVV